MKSNYNDPEIRSDLSHLLKLTEDFLAFEDFRKEEFFKYHYLSKEFIGRHLENLFSKTQELHKESSSVIPIDYSNFFYEMYLIDKERSNMSSAFGELLKKDTVVEDLDYITRSGVYLTAFYVKEIILIYFNARFYLEEFNLKSASSSLFCLVENLNIKKIIAVVNKKNKYRFILGLYYALLNAFMHFDNDKLFLKYKILLNKSINKLNIDELSFHYLNLINYCEMKVQYERKQKFNSELFQIYSEVLENGYFRINGQEYLPKILFRNAIFLGMSLKKYSWVQEIIDNFHMLLSPPNQDPMYTYGYALLYNALGKYNESLTYCNKLNITDYQDKYDIKNLTLQNYYELCYFEESLPLLDSYKHFVKNDLILNHYFKCCYQSFIHFLEKLVLFKLEKHINLRQIYEALRSNYDTALRQWLLLKYENIINTSS